MVNRGLDYFKTRKVISKEKNTPLNPLSRGDLEKMDSRIHGNDKVARE